jgi:hypothetical protein
MEDVGEKTWKVAEKRHLSVSYVQISWAYGLKHSTVYNNV